MGRRLGYAGQMDRRFGTAPSAADIEALARASLQRLPEPFAAHLKDVVLTVEDLADEATLSDMGIEDPFELTGLYHGLPVGDKSVEHRDRKSTRLNSSHSQISYAVFCLKK